MRLVQNPVTVLEVRDDEHVTMTESGGYIHFVGFDPRDLRVRWTQRTPGSVADPRGDRDYVLTGEDRGMLWRARLDADYLAFFYRWDPSKAATIIISDDERSAA